MRELQKEGYTRAIDWWSIGIVLFEMLLGRLPFSAPTRPDLFARILTHDPLAGIAIASQSTANTPLSVSAPAHSLLSHLLRKDPRERMSSFESARCHAFFADIDWQKLARRDLVPPFKPDLEAATSLLDRATSACHDNAVRYFESEFTRQPIELTPPLSRSSTVALNANLNHFDAFSYYGSSAGPSTAPSSTSSRTSLSSQSQTHLSSDRLFEILNFSDENNNSNKTAINFFIYFI